METTEKLTIPYNLLCQTPTYKGCSSEDKIALFFYSQQSNNIPNTGFSLKFIKENIEEEFTFPTLLQGLESLIEKHNLNSNVGVEDEKLKTYFKLNPLPIIRLELSFLPKIAQELESSTPPKSP